MNDLTIFQNEEFGSIRTTIINNEPWFVGKDVTLILGYSNPRDALRKHVDDDDRDGVAIRDAIGRDQIMTIINESGLYSLIFGSKLDSAKRFKRWVTAEVLPQIRKTGTYGIHLPDGSLNLDLIQEMIDRERTLQQQLSEQNNLITAKDQQIAELQPKASYYDVVLNCKDLISVTEFAKDYGWSARRMNKELHDRGIQFKEGKHWFLYQKYAEYGYTSTKTHTFLKNDGSTGTSVHTYWTQKGRLFVYNLLKEDGILPLIETEEEQ